LCYVYNIDALTHVLTTCFIFTNFVLDQAIISIMRISLVITVYNEEANIPRLFDSILEQTRLPDELIVCDGGSIDNTVSIMSKYSDQLPLTILRRPGANISTGRNVAIHESRGDVIVVTDAGVRLRSSWLEMITACFEQREVVHAAGFFCTDAETVFEIAMGATVLPVLGDIRPQTFLPSSRSVAFRKQAWTTVGGYPEWLDYSEDVVFDLKMIDRFGKFTFVPEAMVQFQPRSTIKQFARQYFNYASGDGHAGLFLHIHGIRYFTYLIAIPLGIYTALTVNPTIWLLGIIAGLAYIRRPITRVNNLWHELPTLDRVKAILLIPMIRMIGDLAKMTGYPVGIWNRVTIGRDQ
jgi:glycosyltransferase involved in cell wall biosynthesis